VAELCVLVSAISGLALRQDLAVTGSINQHGEVQAIGAVNEKIEGFFRVCRDAGGLSQHGVVIPAANLRHLMLSLEVREAMTAGRFHVHAIEHVDDALTLFTGLPAGSLDDEGKWTAGSVNARVAERLLHFSQVLRRSRAASLDAAGEASDNGER
jgi:predicted ATP-dependent protease